MAERSLPASSGLRRTGVSGHQSESGLDSQSLWCASGCMAAALQVRCAHYGQDSSEVTQSPDPVGSIDMGLGLSEDVTLTRRHGRTSRCLPPGSGGAVESPHPVRQSTTPCAARLASQSWPGMPPPRASALSRPRAQARRWRGCASRLRPWVPSLPRSSKPATLPATSPSRAHGCRWQPRRPRRPGRG